MKEFKRDIFSYPNPQVILDSPKWKEIRLLALHFKDSFES